jgi:hypothetical protein
LAGNSETGLDAGTRGSIERFTKKTLKRAQ